ncbi:unnamed protein product [Paramecium primaurelia]|uniref:Uncharacterized protein n=1 Tax=Paramecium primaurelia TaxID=5886 RepID=A0A8S1N1V8_PARPR|nr:unnamed protein product [Paramecium primaurelia]
MQTKKETLILKPQLSAGTLNKEPLTIRFLRHQAKSQDLYTNFLQHKEPKIVKQPKKWTLKQLLNIVDKQSSAISSTRFFNIKSSNKRSQEQSKEKDKSEVFPVVEEKFVEEQVGESARIRLVKFLSFHKVNSNGQIDKTKQGFNLNLSQIKQENQSQSNIKKTLIKINTSRFKQDLNNSVSDQRNQLKTIKQKIQNVISSTDRKILISYANTAQQLQLTSGRKRNNRIIKRFQRIIKEIIQVVKYMLKYKLWFCYPITYNRTFLQKVIDKQFEQIKNELHQDPQLVHIRNQYGQTPLHLACIQSNFALTKLFIQNRSYLNSLDCYELTPLSYAILSNSTICLKLLLDSLASPWSPPGQMIDLSKITTLMKEMILKSRMYDVLRIWKREVKIKQLVKQFSKNK